MGISILGTKLELSSLEDLQSLKEKPSDPDNGDKARPECNLTTSYTTLTSLQALPMLKVKKDIPGLPHPCVNVPTH